MINMNAEFLGGELTGQFRSQISEDELTRLGYRSALTTKPHGEELATCIAVPITWTSTESHQAINAKFGADSQRKAGKRSI